MSSSINLIGNGAIGKSLTNVACDFPMTLFNCAGIPHPYFVNKKNIERENLHVKRLIKLAEGYERVIHISTPSVLGDLQHPYDENAKYGGNVTKYGLQKRHVEETLQNSIKDKLIIVRLFSFVSIHLQKQIIYDSIKKLSIGDGTFYVNPDQSRCFVSEIDFKNMIRFLLNNKMCGTINFTNSEPTNLIKAIKYIALKMNYTGSMQFLSNNDDKNYACLISTSSRLFIKGYKLERVGLSSLDEVINYHGYPNI